MRYIFPLLEKKQCIPVTLTFIMLLPILLMKAEEEEITLK